MYPYARAPRVRQTRIDDERLTLSPSLAQLAAELEERAVPDSDEATELAAGDRSAARSWNERAPAH
jgi:hypothetical protein